MRTRTLGPKGPAVSEVGLGCMGMSDFYGPADRTESIATIHAALEAGITLFDTGDFYGMGHNELLLREALEGRKRGEVFIQVKFGAQRDPSGAFIGYDARPAAVKTALAYTLTRLGTDYVDLYQPARLDPAVPIEETVGAIAGALSRGSDIVPLIGARKRRQLHESLGALDLAFRPDELEQAERAVPADQVAGNRYPDAGMSTLDSEGRTHGR